MRNRITVAFAALAVAAPGGALAAPAAKAPPGATALCRDHTYSYSHHRRGTCSWHGGVARWLRIVQK
jgi:hypothetical protein